MQKFTFKNNRDMKAFLHFFSGGWLVFLFLILTSCGDQRAVNRTARAFLQNFYVENNFDAAAAVSTQATQENISTRAMIFRLNPNSATDRFGSFKINNKDVRNTKASVFYTLDGDVERRLNLIKIDGTWLVDMPEHLSTTPAHSISPSRSSGGFASAMSEPVRLRDVPNYNPREQTEENTD